MIKIVDYDHDWPVLFENEAGNILSKARNIITHIEHIGSTSVKNFSAKPVIDIVCGVKQLDKIPSLIEPLNSLSYCYRVNLAYPDVIFSQSAVMTKGFTYMLY